MDGEPSAVHVVGLFAQQVEQLAVNHGDKEVEGAVGVAHDEKQRRFPVAQGVQLQLVVHGDFPQLLNIEGRKARTAGNIDRLGCFARR